jgi:Ca2+-binding RTX toxin-like protein
LDVGGTFGAFDDSTPALAVGTLGRDTEATVFLGYEVFNPTNPTVPLVQISKARASLIGSPANWGTPTLFPAAPDSISVFHPALALDPVANALDALVVETQTASSPAATIVNTFWARFDPTQLGSTPLGPQSVPTSAPTVADLPAREPYTLVRNQGTRFLGEYNGLALKGSTSIFAYPERPAAQSASLGIGFINPQCHTAQFSSLLAGDTWECSCSCQDQQTLTSRMSNVQGCAPEDSSANGVCGDICPGRADGIAPFSPAVVCGTSASTGPARFVASNICRATDGRPPGRLVTDFGDLMVTGGTSSTVTMHKSGSQFNTTIAGTVSANLSGRPAAGTRIEFSRMNLTAQPFSAGGFGTVHDLGIAQKSRFAGTFTDATHFIIPPAAGQLDVSSFVTPACSGSPCDDVQNASHEVNFNPITGTLDLAARRLSFDISESDGPDTIGIHFDGTVTQTPPDTDGDGVFDAADNCPLIANPTQQRVASPRVVAPSAITTSICTGVNLGQPTVTDLCGAGGIVVSNNAPAHFPLGQTVVTWTARDARGNVGTATQTVTAVFVNDASCCPAGMNVIVGTAGNDVLVGTAGDDCILGLGGQDQISGLGGNDLLSGGDGDDVIDGGSGNDRIYGGPGQDHLIGGTGDDLLDGGDGVDLLEGQAGNDTLFGGNGGDHLLGGDGNDQLHGDADDDTLEAGLGTDLLDGGANNDICVAGTGGTKTFVSCETKR